MSKQEWISIADRADTLAKDIYALINKQSEDKQHPRAKITVDSVLNSFTEEQQRFLGAIDEGDHIRVEWNQHVEKVMFADVANRVKGCGGEWITDGKNSHFRVPK